MMRNQGSVDCGVSREPTSIWVTGLMLSMTKPGNTPASRHNAANTSIALRDQRSVSRAVVAASERERPRNVIPNALTKHAAASAAEQASVAPTAGTRSLGTHCGSCGLRRMDWNVTHSDTKPLDGGSAEITMHPARDMTLSTGMHL